MKRERKICPKCGNDAVVPVVYGYPSETTLREGGDVVFGGCCPKEPQWFCRACVTWFASDDGGQTLRPVKRDRGV